MYPVKNRILEVGQRVQVYYNLHKHMFSIKDKRSGFVVAHAETVTLSDVKLIVRQAGRERVIKEKRKNVHAIIEGIYEGTHTPPDELTPLYYNPYKTETFQDRETGKPIHHAHTVHCANKQASYTSRP